MSSGERPAKGASSEYDAVSLRVHWPALSLAAFAVTLPFNYGILWIWPRRTIYIVAFLTSVGVLAGLVGCMEPRRRRWALLGVSLNGLVIVLLLAVQWIYRQY